MRDADYERTPRDGGARRRVPVRRGPQFRTEQVTIAGATAVARGRPAGDAANARRGPVRRERVDSDAATMAEAYRRRGYTQVKVDARRRSPRPATRSPVPDGRAARRSTEGPRTLVGTIAIAGQRGRRRGGRCAPAIASRDRSALLPAAGGARPRRHAAGPAQPRVPVGHRRRPRASSRRTARRADLAFVVAEGPQVFVDHVLIVGNVEDQHRDDPPRGDAAAGRAAQLRRAHGEPAAHQRARALPPRADHRARSRRAEPPRPAGHGRRGAGDHGGLRRRRRGRPRAAPGRAGRRRRRKCSRSRRAGSSSIGRRNLFGRNQSINVFARASAAVPGVDHHGAEGEEEPPPGLHLRDYRLLGTYRAASRRSAPNRPAGDGVSRAGRCDRASTSRGAAHESSWRAG